MTLERYRALLAVGLVVVFFTNAANYGLRFGVPPLYWIAAFVAAATPVAAVDLFRRGLRIEPLGVWAFAYLLLSLAWFVPSSQSALAWQQIQTRVLAVLFVGLSLVLFADRRARIAAGRAIVAATLLAVGLNLYEVAFPMTFSAIPGRASGLYTNVNQSGAALVLGLILGAPSLPSRWRPPFALAVGLGILATVSRAAILAWGLVVAFWAMRPGYRVPSILGGTVLLAAVGLLLLSPAWPATERLLEERGVLTENVRQRLNFFGGGELDDASALERRGVAALAWDTFAERPLTGNGTGAFTEPPFEPGPHNMYLAMMVDHGVVGMFLLPTLILAAAWGALAAGTPATTVVPFALFLAFWGFFSHNVLEERYILLAVAFVATGAAAARRGAAGTGAPR